MTSVLVIFLFCIAGPLLLLPVEKLLPYPYILEELFKVIIVYCIFNLKKEKFKRKLLYTIIAGIIFTVSETIFYLPNFFILGNYVDIPLRLLLTGILHVSTFIILLPLFSISYLSVFLGLVCNGLFHFFFNILMKNWFS